jgi:hypothetical protein
MWLIRTHSPVLVISALCPEFHVFNKCTESTKWKRVNWSTVCSHPFSEFVFIAWCLVILRAVFNALHAKHAGQFYSYVCVSLRNFPLHVLLLLLILLFKNLLIFLANCLHVFILVRVLGHAVQIVLINWAIVANLIFPVYFLLALKFAIFLLESARY